MFAGFHRVFRLKPHAYLSVHCTFCIIEMKLDLQIGTITTNQTNNQYATFDIGSLEWPARDDCSLANDVGSQLPDESHLVGELP